MYPERELSRLAAHKAALQRRAPARREQCRVAADELMRPIRWLDRAVACVRRIPPVAQVVALPLGLLLGRTAFPRSKLLRWAPLVYHAVRALGRTRQTVLPRRSTETVT